MYKRILALLVVLAAGIGFGSAWVMYEPEEPDRVALRKELLEARTGAIEPIIQGKPTRIIIPSLAIDLPIEDGIHDENTGEWTLKDDVAHYAVSTALANNTAGNTFIYGHNNKKVFAELVNISAGSKVYLETDNDKTFVYVFQQSFDVTPETVDAIKYRGEPMLTIQTCVGDFYEDRRIFQLTLDHVIDGSSI